MWNLREGNHWTQTPHWHPNVEVVKFYFNLCMWHWLHCYGWEVMNYPPYRTHLKPNDLYLFALFRKHLANEWFVTDTDMTEVFISWLQTLETNFFHPGIHSLVLCWDKCLNVSGDCVEVLCSKYYTNTMYLSKSEYRFQNITLLCEISLYFPSCDAIQYLYDSTM